MCTLGAQPPFKQRRPRELAMFEWTICSPAIPPGSPAPLLLAGDTTWDPLQLLTTRCVSALSAFPPNPELPL
jgi:hypothetical protein